MNPYDGLVVNNFIVQALKHEEITIYVDGQQTRSFCYVDDLIEAMLRMMDSDDAFIGHVNVGNHCDSPFWSLQKTFYASLGREANWFISLCRRTILNNDNPTLNWSSPNWFGSRRLR